MAFPPSLSDPRVSLSRGESPAVVAGYTMAGAALVASLFFVVVSGLDDGAVAGWRLQRRE
ncbi:hypothetical protein [Halogranum rubrum]|uniref:Uncharacterized protein n=1 Tax=Halogranum salarium B-1 TaxID=1210908 RepID=J3A3S3_9EURY|nr:hypothetical protein [Halogranum salarium]EJN60058.1 hypothetical protein HSB1_22160 [Halogranum salarium B-1]